MVDYRLILHLFLGTITMILCINAFIVFSRYRSKHNLASLIIVSIIFILIIMSYFLPLPEELITIITNIGVIGNILLIVFFVFLLYIFLFYPEIKGFISRRKIKNK